MNELLSHGNLCARRSCFIYHTRLLPQKAVFVKSKNMPRRPPPSPLRLVEGPLPSRRQPKHTLPSVPRPAYHLPIPVVQGPMPRPRARPVSGPVELDLPVFVELDMLPSRLSIGSMGRRSSSDSGMSSPVSASSRGSGSDSGPPSPSSELSLRGPWVHSSSIKIPFDVSAVLPPPKRAALV